jgi:multidrug efflux pump
LVLVGGMTIGSIFTLFILPSIYLLLAKDHRSSVKKTPAVEPELAAPSFAK